MVVTYSPKAQPTLHLFPDSTSSSKKITNEGIILFSLNHHQPGTKDLKYISNSTCQNPTVKNQKGNFIIRAIIKNELLSYKWSPYSKYVRTKWFLCPNKMNHSNSVNITVKAKTTKLDVS